MRTLLSEEEKQFCLEFAVRLDEAIKNADVKKINLVIALGIHSHTFSKWLRGESMPAAYQLIKVAKLLGVKPGQLIAKELVIADENFHKRSENKFERNYPHRRKNFSTKKEE